MKSISDYIFENETITDDAVNEANFPAAFKMDEDVSFHPMFRHLQKFGIAPEERTGTIASVRFTRAKVWYTILDDYNGQLFDDVDSAKVWKPKQIQLPEATS